MLMYMPVLTSVTSSDSESLLMFANELLTGMKKRGTVYPRAHEEELPETPTWILPSRWQYPFVLSVGNETMTLALLELYVPVSGHATNGRSAQVATIKSPQTMRSQRSVTEAEFIAAYWFKVSVPSCSVRLLSI